MSQTVSIENAKPWIDKIARIGLIAKGVVYVILGTLAFMAAFEIAGQTNRDSNKEGVFNSIKEFPGGVIVLFLLAAGLICYSIWRGVQTFSNGNGSGIKWTKRVRYFFSGLIYLSLAGTAIQMIIRNKNKSDDENQYWVSEMLNHSFGQWFVGVGACILAGIGMYQLYYGLSEKYKKHVQELNLHSNGSSLLLRSGKIGYMARGIVWLIIAFLLLRAALHNNSSEAGDMSKAFSFIENASLGSYLLGALGIGLLAYGVFNFIRARYETFR